MSTPFPKLYENHSCPLDGYEAITVRVLVNPTRALKDDWYAGNLGDPTCPTCQPGVYCDVHRESRERFGRALTALFSETNAAGLDFSTSQAALATLDSGTLPDEFVAWLYRFPAVVWARRVDTIEKKLIGSSAIGS